MPKLKYETFDGIYPAITPRNLPSLAAQVAENVDLSGKRLDPWKVPLLVQGLTNHAKIYPWRRGGATEWLSFATDVDVIQSPLGADAYERIYITDGVKPYIKGWQNGAAVNKYMERPTAPGLTATATDRVGFGAAEMSLVKARWVYTGKIYYTKTVGGVSTDEEHAVGTNLLGNVVSVIRDQNTGTWNVEMFFSNVPVWSISTPAGTRITDITADITGYWEVKWGAEWKSLGDIIELNDGSSIFGEALISGVLPVPTYVIGEHSVTHAAFNANVQFVPTFADSSAIRFVFYRQTFVDDWGMEGPAGPDSGEVAWIPGQKIVLSVLGALQGSKRRIYRTLQGQTPADDMWFRVAELTSETTYEDVQTDEELNADQMPAFENPPDDMRGLIMTAMGFAVAFRGKEVLFSEPDNLHSWPSKYREVRDWNIVGLATNGNDIYVLTEGMNYVASGYHPESLSWATLATHQSCVSKKSIAVMGSSIVYASPDGLVAITGGQVSLLTKAFYKRENWQALNPSAMIGAVNDNIYFGFLASGAIVFRPYEGADTLTTLTLNVTAAYYDLLDDTLYLVQSSGGGAYSLYKWNRGASNMTMRWRGKEVVSEHRLDWSAARVEAAAYPVTLRVYSQNTLGTIATAADNKSFRMPKMVPERVISVEIESSNAVNMAEIGTSKGAFLT